MGGLADVFGWVGGRGGGGIWVKEEKCLN